MSVFSYHLIKLPLLDDKKIHSFYFSIEMSVFSYHLIKLPLLVSIKGIFSNPIAKNTNGLIHSEYMTAMTLGSPILSPSRLLIRQVAIFAQWESEFENIPLIATNNGSLIR